MFGLFLFTLFIIFLLLITNNTPFLRKNFIHFILPLVNNSLIAKIELEDLKFRSFNSVVLRNFKLITDGDTLAQFEELNLKIKLSELWNNKIVIRNLLIKNPNIKLIRNPIDSIWNYEKISPQSEEETTAGKSPVILIRNLSIQNGKFKFYDPLHQDSSLAFNPMNLQLDKLNIHLKAKLDLDKSTIYSQIHNLAFEEINTNTKVDSMKFALNISKNFTKMDYFLLSTGSTRVKIFAELFNFNPLDTQKYDKIENAKISSRLKIVDLNTDLPLRFVHLPFKNNQVLSSSITLDGSIDNLTAYIKSIKYQNSELRGIANVFYDKNNNLNYILNLQNSIIHQKEINDLLNIDLASIPKFEKVTIDNLLAQGTEKSMELNGKLSTANGGINIQAKINFEPTIEYDLTSKFHKLNIGKLLNNNELYSDLNGILSISGSGDDFSKIVSHINTQINNSTFRNIAINESNIKISLNNGIISIDTIQISLPNIVDPFNNLEYPSSVGLSGEIDLMQINHPKYNFDFSVQNIDLAKITQNSALPNNISFISQISGNSFDIDKITVNSKLKFDEITFADISFLPFDLDFNIVDIGDNTKNISLNFMQDSIWIKGKFNISELTSKLPNLIEFSSLYFRTRYEEFFLRKQDSLSFLELQKLAKSIKLPNLDAFLSLKFNNFFFLNSFFKDLTLISSLDWKGNIRSSSDNTFIDFSNCKIGNTKISANGFGLQTDDFLLNFAVNITKNGDNLNLSFGNFNIDELEYVVLDKIKITKPKVNFLALDNKFSAEFGLNYDTLLTSYAEIEGKILAESINLAIPKFTLDLMGKLLSFRNLDKAQIDLDAQGIAVKDFDLTGKNNEIIKINAYLTNNFLNDTKIRLENFKLSSFAPLLTQFQIEELNKSQFNLNFLEFTAEGNTENPNYKMQLLVDTAKVMGTDFGKIVATLFYLDSNITGSVELKESRTPNSVPLNFQIISFPYNLSLTERFGTFSGTYLARLKLDTFRLGVIDPFLPIVRNLQGTMNGIVDIVGSDFERYSLNGNLQTNNTSFVFDLTNLPYQLTANINLKDNKILFDTLKLRNFGTASLATITGWMKVENNELTYLDLNAKASNFLLLDDISKKKIPQFYGKLSVDTKYTGLNLQGNPKQLNITGDVQINPSNLTIANLEQAQQTTKTNFEYRIVGDKTILTINTQTDSAAKQLPKEPAVATQIPDIQMNVYIPKTINLTFDLGPIGEVVAILGSSDPTIPLVYVMDKDNPLGQLYGELVIKEGSKLNSYKQMNAQGTITFQSRDITNPTIDIVGEYNGKIDDPINPIRYTIKIFITGTAQQPKVRFDYTLNGIAPQAEQKKIEENALYLLLFGQLPGSGDAVLDPNVVNKLSSAGISSLASRSISDLLLRTGFIESADFQIDSQDFEKTKINFKGKLYGSVNWSLGGSIADLTKNNQITIEMPIYTDSKLFNQIVWMLSYSTNLNSTVFDPDEKNWEMKLKFGGSW